MKLTTKISITIISAILLAVVSSGVALFSARWIGALMQNMVAENVASVRAAEELEVSLLEQRGLVASFILDGGNPAWLDELEGRKPDFSYWLQRAQGTAHTAEEHEILEKMLDVYQEYNTKQDEVIALYHEGKIEQARAVLLEEVNTFYDSTYSFCEDLIAANERYIDSRIAEGRNQIKRVSVIVGVAVIVTIGLGLALLLISFRGVFLPLRRMAENASLFVTESHQPIASTSSQDELRSIGFYLRTLISDVTETRSHLERSRAQLINAEKLASVGKLAAGVAHEIRNPLTSLKMRLFSIRRAIGKNSRYEDDFRIISEEITRLENVIRNFLEFSRPQKLNLHNYDISILIDKTLELFGPVFSEKKIKLIREAAMELPQVRADSEQIKQVFINLLRNSIEAMESGEIQILVKVERSISNQQMVVVRFQDNGPGIPASARDRIFEPFFSTREEGIGLGLCIAAQIMAGHEGKIELEFSSNRGTCFAVWIPIAREDNG